MSDKIVSVERVIDAPADRLFDIVADPRRHVEIDGSGTVRQADVDGPERLSLGAKFAMAMKLGMKYRMINTVTEFEENRLIAWAPKPEVRGQERENLGGRVYRYEFEPAGEGRTLVRETWDATAELTWWLHRVLGTARKVRKSMTKTLDRLAEIAATT